MKGLLIKDIRLMKVQKNFFLLIFAVGIGLAVFTKNISFIIGYISVICSMFTLSSISYDEFDNGGAFLFSLPINRKDYVKEKYLFGLLIGGSTWIASTLIALGAAGFRQNSQIQEIWITAFVILPLLLWILAIMIPVQLKYGGEKGRIAIIGFVGVVFLFVLIVKKFSELLKVDFTKVTAILSSLHYEVVIGIILAAVVAAMLVSYRISVSIIQKKEF